MNVGAALDPVSTVQQLPDPFRWLIALADFDQ